MTRKTRIAALLVVLAALAAALGRQPPASPSSAAPPRAAAAPPVDTPRRALGEAGGALPDDTTVFDEQLPGVGKLDPALREALRRAAADAAADGVALVVDSGWRSTGYQERLLREAIVKYGSPAKAARWVARPETSAHVSGDAVDLGPADALAWLSAHGASYGLCRIYANEPWHYELRPAAARQGCPPRYPDPTFDPRMRP